MILLIDPVVNRREEIARELGEDLVVERIPYADRLDSYLAAGQTRLQAIVVGPDVPFNEALDLAEKVASAAPDVGVILVGQHVTAEDLKRAMRAGVLDVLNEKREQGELRQAVDRSRARYAQLHADEPDLPAEGSGRIIAVFSTKGGSGKSFIASNLAVLLADRVGHDQVALIDLDLQSGDLAIMLQLLPNWAIDAAAAQGMRLDEDALRGFLTHHRSGVHLLAAPTDPAASEQISSEIVHHILRICRETFPVTIIDCPAFFSDQALAALDMCDEVVLVGSLDVPSVKNLKLALQTLEALHISRDRIRVVLNRADSAVGLRLNEVERSLGTAVDVAVPSSREVPLSINQGTPLVTVAKKRSAVLNALEKLADSVVATHRLVSEQRPTPEKRRITMRSKEG